jgi:hypothetical protein
LALLTNRLVRIQSADFGEDAPFTERSGIRRICAPGY